MATFTSYVLGCTPYAGTVAHGLLHFSYGLVGDLLPRACIFLVCFGLCRTVSDGFGLLRSDVEPIQPTTPANVHEGIHGFARCVWRVEEWWLVVFRSCVRLVLCI